MEQLRAELPLVEFIGLNPFIDIPERVVDLMYRPCQVSQLVELDFLARAGERFVVNQLDTIAFENPAYFGSDEDWVAYRDLTRLTLELAHGVAFLSEHSHEGVRAEGLLPPDTPWAVVSCGIDDPQIGGDGERPSALAGHAGDFLLCIGASYLHKNRHFALEAWAELRRRGLGWPPGPRRARRRRTATPSREEAEFLLRHPELRPHVVMPRRRLRGREALAAPAHALVLYPSTVEGFGLVPFEAAQVGTATLATRQGSLEEVLPAGIPALDSFDVAACADAAWELLHDAAATEALATALRVHSQQFTWDATADRLINLFTDALARPGGRVLVLEGEGSRPIGLASRAQRSGRAVSSSGTVERLVQAIISRPSLKHSLSPDGSRRQHVARNVISQVRRLRS